MNISQITNENAEDLNIGDPVIITGNVQFKGKTGDIVDFGKDKRFVIVNLYNYGKHSFHSSDVSYNDYAESGDEQERMSQYESKTGTKFVGKWRGTDSADKARERLVGEAKSLQSKFEKHLARHGYDVGEKSKYWEKKLKDIDAQIAAWDAEMAARKQGKETTNEDGGDYYCEILAQKVFDERPHFSTKGRADELVDYAYRFAVQDLGKSRARYEFNYDEDFLSDFVSAYGELQRGEQGVAEGDELNVGIEAYGVRGASSKKWRKTFKNQAAFERWLDANEGDVEVLGTREVNLNDMFKEGVAEDSMDPNAKPNKIDRKKEPNTRSERYYKNKEEKKKQGVAEGEYDDPRWEEEPRYKRFDPDAWKELRDREEEEAAMSKGNPSTVTVRDAEGNVVLQFPSTGGYYGDVRMALSKGFDTEAGDYDIKWQKNEDAMMSEDTGTTSEQVAAEIVRRIIFKHKDAISAFGPEAIMAAAREVGEFFAGAEDLGTSDIGIATKYTLEKLDQMSQGNLQETASGGATGAGSIAATPAGGSGKNVGSLFGGTYKQKRTKKSPGTK